MANPFVFWGLFVGAALIFQVSPTLGGILVFVWLAWFLGGLIYEPKEVRDKRRAHRESQRATEEIRRKLRQERQQKIAAGELPPSFRSYDEYMKSEWWRLISQQTLRNL